jgi:uncharacterized protein YbbC (DUF1343 family)
MAIVVTGLERFAAEGLPAAGLGSKASVGLLAHAASVDRQARHSVELVRGVPGVELVRLFAPEHGLWGHEQDMERVAHTADPATGLDVVSLYGDNAEALRPRAEDLEGLDAILVDVQDVGSRYYTYVHTLSYVMQAAAEAGPAVVVLDRPNPIGGQHVEGPVLHSSLHSFVGRYPIPVRHGMTVGELARLFNDAFGIGCDLRVVEMANWSRKMSFGQTGLPWVPPSPNMPSPTTALVYPGGCLLEGTNLSEGRGTTTPFELAGAPWLDGAGLVAALRAQRLSGVVFREASFRPMFQKHAGRPCSGVHVLVSDPETFEPFASYLVLIREARRLAPEPFRWRTEPYEFETERLAIDLLLGRPELRELLESGASLDEMRQSWRDELDRFGELRAAFQLYG